MTQKNKENQTQQSPERFFKLLEAGDLAFLELMEYAFIIFGVTKHGKTTLSHFLVNNLLKAYRNERKQVHYRLETNKLSGAKIGQKMQSETQIPNKFQTPIKIGENTLYVIDNPGQLDSFGINRVLSNAYFHYRVFSKVKNMKIILVFDLNTFSNNLKDTNAIFKLFFQSFVDFESISNQMLKSIAIIFTKVNKQVTLGDVHQKLSAYQSTFNSVRAFSKEQISFLSKLFKQCKQNQKIKLFRQADLNIESGKCTFLPQLNEKMQFFSRKTDQSQKISSLYFNEKRVEMDNIKFSQSKTLSRLAIDDFENQKIVNLFNELSQRGNNMFSLFFEFIQNLFQFLLFGYDSCQNVGKSIDKSEIWQQTRKNKLRDILLKLQRFSISYDEEQKYKKNRVFIIEKYKQKLFKSVKLQTFVDRLELSAKLKLFCNKYTDHNTFINRTPQQILACKQDIEKIFLQISAVFQSTYQIEKLSEFLYNINTFMNQLVIFCQIIFPNEKQGKQKLRQFVSQYPFYKFFNCFLNLIELGNNSNQLLTDKMSQGFNLSPKQDFNMDTQFFVSIYLKKNPFLLVNHRQNSEILLQKLSKISLSEQNKIDCVKLMFNTLKQQYQTFIHFKKIVNKSKNNEQFQQQILSQEDFHPKDVKKMILSFINLLKQLKKIKDLFCYKIMEEKYRQSTYLMSTKCWNYIINLFVILVQCGHKQQKIKKSQQILRSQRQSPIKSQQKLSNAKSPKNIKSQEVILPSTNKTISKYVTQQQSAFFEQIIIQILSNHQNIGLIEEIFNKLINFKKQNFNQITLQYCAIKINQNYGKILQGYEKQCMIMLEQEKNKYAQKIISIFIKYASILNSLYLKQKAMQQCNQAIRYAENCFEKMEQIQDKIQEIQINNSHNGEWFMQQKENKKINQFQPSLTTKRLLTKFTLDYKDIEMLNCVKIDIFNCKNGSIRKID